MRAELTDLAERDIRHILRSTIKLFGPKQVRAYAAVIERGIAMVAEEPERPVSAACDELVPGVRRLNLEHAAKRRGGASHCLYYIRGRLKDGSEGIIVVRVLHERMEPRHRLVRRL
ncbi:type II toxin-antitoxin system RelE/ParE family toxin [Nitratireductor basaltis]|uniref:Gyrase inhibitor ParE n=1 Tax=Nitratireductor basaltis TaxID=472175 RepID=A0A084U9P0_9HYPH|nr:type II toxin-antitoxin system RelE/ParE family toxin [Nitratireductor basaltis]KFB09676.1 Gyrase inhibitor ParE [Nitratireductor basaltis]